MADANQERRRALRLSLPVMAGYVVLGIAFGEAGDGLRQLAAVTAVVLLHLRWRNTLLSVGAGTALYILLIRL